MQGCTEHPRQMSGAVGWEQQMGLYHTMRVTQRTVPQRLVVHVTHLSGPLPANAHSPALWSWTLHQLTSGQSSTNFTVHRPTTHSSHSPPTTLRRSSHQGPRGSPAAHSASASATSADRAAPRTPMHCDPPASVSTPYPASTPAFAILPPRTQHCRRTRHTKNRGQQGFEPWNHPQAQESRPRTPKAEMLPLHHSPDGKSAQPGSNDPAMGPCDARIASPRPGESCCAVTAQASLGTKWLLNGRRGLNDHCVLQQHLWRVGF